MSGAFAIDQEALDDHRHLVAISGEIDLFTAPELKQILSEAIAGGCTGLIVDLTRTTFLDSTALGVLIGALRRLREGDGSMVVVNVDATIGRTLEITGLDRVFTLVGSREAAIGELDAPRPT